MNQPSLFDSRIPLPDERLSSSSRHLLGFDTRYARVQARMRLLLQTGELSRWNGRFHRGGLALCEFVADQYPLVIFHGDVGTGKTATAEGVANRLVEEAKVEDAVLFRLSNRVRGKGLVGQMSDLLADAFAEVTKAAGKNKRAVLILDEADSLGASRTQGQSHHEDKVAVNTLIQCIDDLRRLGGRVVVILCTNRASVLDPALLRRAAVVEEFHRPTEGERRQLFTGDLVGLEFTPGDLDRLVTATGSRGDGPPWTYSDIRTRLYPEALASVFPDRGITITDLLEAASRLKPSPVLEDI